MLDVATIGAIMSNILTAVGVVIVNKYIVSIDEYHCMLFLSFLHFVFTFWGMWILCMLGTFEHKPASSTSVLFVAMGSLSSTAFMNLNLAHNSVGIYQLSKLACIPVTILLERLIHGRAPSTQILLTLIPITMGVGIATLNDVSVNFLGTVYACIGVLCASASPIITGSLQRSLNLEPMQLLYHTSPVIASGMLVMVPLFDDMHMLLHTHGTDTFTCRIFLSCTMALGVNLSHYAVLKHTTALTYQVLGHCKTMAVLGIGYVMFRYENNWRGLLGMGLAFSGVVAYTEVNRRMSATILPIETQKHADTYAPSRMHTVTASCESDSMLMSTDEAGIAIKEGGRGRGIWQS